MCRNNLLWAYDPFGLEVYVLYESVGGLLKDVEATTPVDDIAVQYDLPEIQTTKGLVRGQYEITLEMIRWSPPPVSAGLGPPSKKGGEVKQYVCDLALFVSINLRGDLKTMLEPDSGTLNTYETHASGVGRVSAHTVTAPNANVSPSGRVSVKGTIEHERGHLDPLIKHVEDIKEKVGARTRGKELTWSQVEHLVFMGVSEVESLPDVLSGLKSADDRTIRFYDNRANGWVPMTEVYTKYDSTLRDASISVDRVWQKE
jgi:hypothetical protein